MRLGAHMSIAGGVVRSLERGRSVGCDAIQIFTCNTNQWRWNEVSAEMSAAFRSRQAESGITPVFAHNAYLINLASPDPDLYQRSLEAMTAELRRCEALGLPFVVMHPGSHKKSGVTPGIRRVAEGLQQVLDAVPAGSTRILLENTAGQGDCLGHRFDQLQEILDRAERPERTGVCVDTCHLFAAGYDIRNPEGYHATWAEFDGTVGLNRLFAMHLNDSLKDLGSRVDRHQHIGQGFLGVEPFRLLLNDPRLDHLPAVLETPKNEACDEDRTNLALLRSLIGQSA